MFELDGMGNGPVKHKGGSKSAFEYTRELAAKRGVTTKDSLHDAFEVLHRTKDKSVRIVKEIEEMAQELRRPLPDTIELWEMDLNLIYLEVMGGGVNKKKMLFSAGSPA